MPLTGYSFAATGELRNTDKLQLKTTIKVRCATSFKHSLNRNERKYFEIVRIVTLPLSGKSVTSRFRQPFHF